MAVLFFHLELNTPENLEQFLKMTLCIISKVIHNFSYRICMEIDSFKTPLCFTLHSITATFIT